MKTIKDIESLSGKKVLVRVDYNVPMKDGKIIDDFRIKKSIETIEYLHKKGASVILLAHLGSDGKESLKPIAVCLKKYLPKVIFIDTPLFSDATEDALKKLEKGSIVLLENIRREDGEMKNTPSYARSISRYGDLYVNDAFSVSHRAHASVVGITKYLQGYAGFQMMYEIENLSKAFAPVHPFLFILGGAKFETKIPLIKKFIRSTDMMFIGGALANDFFKMKGYEVGTSLVDDTKFHLASLAKYKNLLLPVDVKVALGKKSYNREASDVHENECIVDIGEKSLSDLSKLINEAKFILWNGPLGKYEEGNESATEKILKLIQKSKANSIIGGGDTVALISKLKLENKLGFVSTGGGATLEFLAKGSLPGIKALK
jgi:phosphoglycerate kinase